MEYCRKFASLFLGAVACITPLAASAALSPSLKAIPDSFTTTTNGIVVESAKTNAPIYGSVAYRLTLTSTIALTAGTFKTVTVSIPAGISINPGPRTYNSTACTTTPAGAW